MMQQFSLRSIIIGMLALTLALFSACGASSTTASTPGSSTPIVGGTTTPTTAPPTTVPSTATPSSGPVTCDTLTHGGHTANAGSSFPDLPFPAGSLSGPLTPHQVGIGYGWDIYLLSVCSPGTTASAVRAFFAAQLPASGWAYSPYLPFDGSFEQACGDAYCWLKDHAPRLIGLEAVTDHTGGAVGYTLRLFIPPGDRPDCGTLVFGGASEGYTLFFRNITDIPLPPLTQIGSGHQQNHFEESPLCSASNADADNLFMHNALARDGWIAGTYDPTSYCGESLTLTGPMWVKSGRFINVQYQDSTGSSTSATLNYCAPDVGP